MQAKQALLSPDGEAAAQHHAARLCSGCRDRRSGLLPHRTLPNEGMLAIMQELYTTQLTLPQINHRRIIEREGCEPLRCLPNKWFPPFGLDKLRNVIQAEATRTYPLLMLRDHENFGDTYAQWGGSMYTVITRDILNIRAVLSGQFKCRILRPCLATVMLMS